MNVMRIRLMPVSEPSPRSYDESWLALDDEFTPPLLDTDLFLVAEGRDAHLYRAPVAMAGRAAISRARRPALSWTDGSAISRAHRSFYRDGADPTRLVSDALVRAGNAAVSPPRLPFNGRFSSTNAPRRQRSLAHR